MATAAVAFPSASRLVPGSYPILAATLPVAKVEKGIDANSVVEEWLKTFQQVLDAGDYKNGLQNLFWKEAYWRDQLCLSWDYRTYLQHIFRTAWIDAIITMSRYLQEH